MVVVDRGHPERDLRGDVDDQPRSARPMLGAVLQQLAPQEQVARRRSRGRRRLQAAQRGVDALGDVECDVAGRRRGRRSVAIMTALPPRSARLNATLPPAVIAVTAADVRFGKAIAVRGEGQRRAQAVMSSAAISPPAMAVKVLRSSAAVFTRCRRARSAGAQWSVRVRRPNRLPSPAVVVNVASTVNPRRCRCPRRAWRPTPVCGQAKRQAPAVALASNCSRAARSRRISPPRRKRCPP